MIVILLFIITFIILKLSKNSLARERSTYSKQISLKLSLMILNSNLYNYLDANENFTISK